MAVLRPCGLFPVKLPISTALHAPYGRVGAQMGGLRDRLSRPETEAKTTYSQHLPSGLRKSCAWDALQSMHRRVPVFWATVEILLTVSAEWVACVNLCTAIKGVHVPPG